MVENYYRLGCEAYPVWAMIIAFRAVKNKHPKSGILLPYACFLVITNTNYFIMSLVWPFLGLFLQQIAITLLFTYVVGRFLFLRRRNKVITANEPDQQNLSLNEKIIYWMEQEKKYRNPKLTLTELSLLTGTNRTTLSTVIRDMGYDSFPDFLNAYRLREFKEELEKGNTSSFTDIAVKVGFGSRATFYNYFRKKEQMTPAQYVNGGKGLNDEEKETF